MQIPAHTCVEKAAQCLRSAERCSQPQNRGQLKSECLWHSPLYPEEENGGHSVVQPQSDETQARTVGSQAPELEGPKPTVTVSSSQATPWESGHRVKQKNLGAQNLWPLTNTYFLLWLAG